MLHLAAPIEAEDPATEEPPTEPPTEAPTEPLTVPAGIKLTTADGPTTFPSDPTCARQKAKFAAQDLPIDEPKLDAFCQFAPRQFNANRCWCVKAKSGNVKGEDFNFPRSEPYHCIGKLTKENLLIRKKMQQLLSQWPV